VALFNDVLSRGNMKLAAQTRLLEVERNEVAGLQRELKGLNHTLKIQEERLKQARLASAKDVQEKANSQKKLKLELDKCKKRLKTIGEISIDYENRYAIELERSRKAYELKLQQECVRECCYQWTPRAGEFS
jgi:hypothetical protein